MKKKKKKKNIHECLRKMLIKLNIFIGNGGGHYGSGYNNHGMDLLNILFFACFINELIDQSN